MITGYVVEKQGLNFTEFSFLEIVLLLREYWVPYSSFLNSPLL